MKIRIGNDLTNDENDLMINIRLFWFHIQVTKDYLITFCSNDYHKNLHHGIFKSYKFSIWK